MLLNASSLILTFPIFAIITGMHFKRDKSWTRLMLYILFYLYLYKLISITLFPVSLIVNEAPFSLTRFKELLSYHIFIPFQDIGDMLFHSSLKTILYNIGGNMLLLMPLGFLIKMLSPRTSLLKVGLTCFLVSLSIELSQLIMFLTLQNCFRTFSVDDLILNTTGGLMGGFAYLLAMSCFRKIKKHCSEN